MWRLTHRRLHLLSSSWYANHLGRTQPRTAYILCGDSRPETLSHLFSDCAMAKELWTSLQPLLTLLHADMSKDHRPARLVRHLTIFPLTCWLQTHRWPQGLAPPPPPPCSASWSARRGQLFGLSSCMLFGRRGVTCYMRTSLIFFFGNSSTKMGVVYHQGPGHPAPAQHL